MSQPPSSACRYVISATRETFERDAIARSHEVPVVVDFWATWCGPCRLLGPLLEQLAEEYAGRFVLVKADTDQLAEVALAFQVQSIPAVFGVLDGRPVDWFQGALPEPQVRAWLEDFLLRVDLTTAKRLEDEDAAAAETIYRRVLEKLPHEAAAAIGLARLRLAQGQREEAQAIVQQLEGRGFLEPEAEKLKAVLELGGRTDADVAACRAALAADPENLELQLEWAKSLAAQERYQEALEQCLQLVERDRHGAGEAARRVMLDIFRVLPDESELVQTYRRRLATVLY
jgi:putative thioredoxin